MAHPTFADPLPAGDGSTYDNERLRPGIYPAAPVPEDFAVPHEPGHPPLDIDWSVGLRGSLTSSTDGDSFITTLTPQVSGTALGRRGSLAFDASADIAKSGGDNQVLPTGVDLSLSGQYTLDENTSLNGEARIAYARDLPGEPGLDPLIIRPAEEVTGALSAGLDRRFGRFTVGLKGSAERTVYGDTLRADTGQTSNADQNLWSLGSTLRVGYRATPIFEVFGEAGATRDIFDQPSARLGERFNATGQTLRGGITGRWGDVLTATASAGVGRRDFDAAGFDDVTTQLYDASVTFSPDPTLTVTAGLSTAIAPPGADSDGIARFEHTATADIDYTVNSWLRMRASADWTRSRQVDGPETETRYDVRAGADYSMSRHTSVSADYAYGHRDNSTTGTLDSHTVSLGITLKR
ncbi:outer membrane beta-barrel protein [Devosia sp. PTR5]|uniref:Outer membrane beta-barrel protein n=1 Tax=Devosia oryzisoli TaxID=2774138 RepID=A0A927FUA9_9HYPH|nr:outer membrane beta-barrel protein [Devosia oryzisoli]MBD8066430.1 outer membrane beta-barrel protein [Devosia oryzisoli]